MKKLIWLHFFWPSPINPFYLIPKIHFQNLYFSKNREYYLLTLVWSEVDINHASLIKLNIRNGPAQTTWTLGYERSHCPVKESTQMTTYINDTSIKPSIIFLRLQYRVSFSPFYTWTWSLFFRWYSIYKAFLKTMALDWLTLIDLFTST